MTGETSPRPRSARSRRELLRMSTRLAAGGGVAALIASCGDDVDPREPEEPKPERDVAVLGVVLDQEHVAIAAYAKLIGALAGGARRRATRFREQEERHAEVLAGAIEAAGGVPRRARPGDEYAAGFPPLSRPGDALRFAVDVERTAVGAYLDALPKLSTGSLRATAAAIVTTEAEQLSVLLLELGLPPVPEPFVGGEPPR